MGERYDGPVTFRADLNDGRGGYVALDAHPEYEQRHTAAHDKVAAEIAKKGRKDRAALRAFSDLELHPHSQIPVDHDWGSMQQVVWVPDDDGVGGHFQTVDDDNDPWEAQQAIYAERAPIASTE